MEPYFDRLADKYKCCCGCMHVETGTKIICGLAFATYLLSALSYFIAGPTTIYGNGEWVRILLGAMVVAAPLIGLSKTRPAYFIPYLVVSFISLLSFMVQIPLMILALNSSNTIGKKLREMVDHMHEDKKFHTDAEIDKFVWEILVHAFISSLIGIWFFSVVYKCFKYVSDKKAAGYNEVSIPQPNAAPIY